MRTVPVHLSHKLGAVLLVLMLTVAVVTGSVVYFGFQRTQDNARESSQAGLEELGLGLMAEMAQSRSALGLQQIEHASRVSREMAQYFLDFEAQGGALAWDPSRLARGSAGQQFDPTATRRSDVFVPSDVQLSEAVLEDLTDSAALDAVFAAMFTDEAGEGEGDGFDAVALFFHSVNHAVRYYPAIGLAEIVPPDMRLQADLDRAGPDMNPERATVWSDPYEDEAGQGLLITASTPVYEGDVYRGRMGVDVSMSWLAEQIDRAQPTPGGFAFYVDRTGNLLDSSGGGILPRNLAGAPSEGKPADVQRVIDEMKDGRNGAARVTLDGEDYFIAYSSFGDVGGSFAVAAPVAEITAQAAAISASIDEEGNRTVLIVLGIIALLFAFALGGATLMNRRILLRPIEALVTGTQEVARGNMDVSVAIKGRDEMAALARAFNDMTSEIRQRRAALEEEVSQRQSAQEELQALFSAMTDSVLVVDEHGRYVQVASTGAPGYLAVSMDLVGRSVHEVMPAEQAALFMEKVAAARSLHETQTFEYPAVAAGERYWVSASASPMASGLVLVVQRDITQTKQNEQDLRSWQQRHLTMVNSVDAVLWEAPPDFSCFTFVSGQAERLLGYPLHRWLNEPSFWADHIHPEDREWCVSFCLAKTAAGEDHDFEYRMIAADGRTVWLRDIVTVVTEGGEPVAMRGVMVDITQLKEAFSRLSEQETQYRAVFEEINDGVAISDRETGIVLAANPAFAHMHGYEDMAGMPSLDFVHPDSQELFQKFRDEVSAGREFRGRGKHIRMDGSVIDVEVMGRPFQYQDKTALLTVMRDITEEVRTVRLLEERVRERTRELESLLGVGRAVASTLDMNDVVRLILAELGKVVRYSAASLILIEGDELVVYDVLETGETGSGKAGVRVPRPTSPESWPGVADVPVLDYPCVHFAASPDFWDKLERGTTISISDALTAEEPAAVAYRASMGGDASFPGARAVRSWMAVPLVQKDGIAGYIGVASSRPDEFTEKDALLARAFADYASVAIENARLYEEATYRALEVDRRRMVAEGLRDLLAIVNSARSLDEILNTVAAQARRLLESDASAIVLPDDDGTHLVTRARSGRDELTAQARLDIEQSAVGVAFTQQRPTSVYDVSTVYDTANLMQGQAAGEPHFQEHGSYLLVTYLPISQEENEATRVRTLGSAYRGFLTVPLASKDHSYGALSLHYREPRDFTDEQIALAVAFADQAALAIENARLSEQVQAAAISDERQRLARELHDAVTQTLFSTSLIAEVVPDLWETKPDLARARLEDLRRLTRGALAEMRTLLIELRPGALTELPLGDLLRQLAEATAGRTNLRVTVNVEGQAFPLPSEVQVALYRIAQEALNNVVRHAQAAEGTIALAFERESTVSLCIRDDGRGFDPASIPGGHLGVGIMHERAGAIEAAFQVQSAPGKGTSISVRWSATKGKSNGAS